LRQLKLNYKKTLCQNSIDNFVISSGRLANINSTTLMT